MIRRERIHLTDEEWTFLQRRRGRSPLIVALDQALPLVLVLLVIAMGAVVAYDRFIASPPQPAAPSAPTAAVSFVAPSGGYAPQPAPQGSNPAPAADGAALVAPTPEPPPPTATPAPTADLAQQADVDALANAADEAAGGNPTAASPLPAGYVDLPTVEIKPIDPSGGDSSTLARACANSGAGASCTDPSAAANEAQMACALDMAYATTGSGAGGRGCTLPVVRP